MALTRYVDDYQLSELEGVRFLMTEDGKTPPPATGTCNQSINPLETAVAEQFV